MHAPSRVAGGQAELAQRGAADDGPAGPGGTGITEDPDMGWTRPDPPLLRQILAELRRLD
jgi:hypothetical protein